MQVKGGLLTTLPVFALEKWPRLACRPGTSVARRAALCAARHPPSKVRSKPRNFNDGARVPTRTPILLFWRFGVLAVNPLRERPQPSPRGNVSNRERRFGG